MRLYFQHINNIFIQNFHFLLKIVDFKGEKLSSGLACGFSYVGIALLPELYLKVLFQPAATACTLLLATLKRVFYI